MYNQGKKWWKVMEGSGFRTLSSIDNERVALLNQRRKAYVLIFMMIMLAQTSYIGAMQGWTYLQDNDVNATGASCSSITRTSGTPIYVDAVDGSDDWDGTWSCPKATLSDALNDSVSDDEIILYEGRYQENVTVDNKDNLLIRAADGARVVFDGTKSITDDLEGVWGTADSDGIQEVTLTEDGWQLFLAYEEQVPARWPNAQFSDETVFNRSYWAEGTLTNSNNAYTQGWLTDAGPETGVHSGLNETINATGLNPVGAIAVLNLGSFRSNSREITDWNSANGTFAYDGTGVGWKTKHHAYFLEGKRELIDVDGEWWFDNSNNKLHYKTPSGQDANDLDLRVKVQPFAIGVENSDGVTIQGIDFFGTTVNFNECDGCSFTNSTLEYPSTSKRGLGIAGESEDDRWMTRFYRSTNSFVDNISITNTDGGAIEFQGSAGQSNNNTVNNSYFHAIDWSAADQKGLMVTIYEGGRDMYFTNNSVHLTGASSVLSIGDAPKVFYNEVWDVGHLQTDGAVVQVMQAEAPGAEIAYNWIHDIIKYGARFDAPIGEAGEGRNGTMHHNVIWNAAGGLMVKGDYHDINNNTVFNSTLNKNDMIILTDNDVNNGNSTIHQNAADKMADHRSDSWSLYPLPSGTYWDNWNGYVNTTDTVSNQLVDPINFDFRPNTNSHLDNMSAGAYDAGDTDPWTAGVSWTYSPMSDPISGCMDTIAINYNSNAVFADGSCTYTTLSSSSSTLSLEVGVTMTPHTLDYSTPFLADDKQTADSSDAVGMGTNIALDSNGAVHICSKKESSDDLYYTTNASGSWDSATIDSDGNIGGDCFIILDSDDDIHITYYDDTNNVLKYATKALSSGISSTNWANSTLDINGDVGNFGSMAVDDDDTLHVAYYRTTGSSLKYATLVDGGSSWSIETVESTNNIGKFTSIALDSNGKPHITYRDVTNTNLRYAHKMGSSWVTATIDSTSLSGTGTSLAIDSNDHLHVAYKTNSTEIAYMTNQSGSWVKTTLDANSSGSWGVNYINLMLDEGDDPHVVYTDMVDYDVFYMSNTRGTWERVLIAGDSISKTSDATMDENGGIHVAYYIDGSFDDIGYAAVRSLTHRPQFEIEPDLPNGVFLGVENGTIYGTPSEVLDLTEYTIWANTTRTSAFTTLSMNVDWELMPSVSTLEVQRNTAITPITFNWTAWSSGVVNSTTDVQTTGNAGEYNNIGIDSNDKVHIVFYRSDNTNIYYSTNASGSWVTSTVDSGTSENPNVGKYCSLAIDSNDGLHVSYQVDSGNDLNYAYKASGSSSWSKTTVASGGKFTSIAIDSNDKPHIAYRVSGGDLGYAEKTGSSWNSGTVQNAGDIAYTSIALDSDDHIHIAYYDSNNKDMFHLTNTSGSWIKSNLEDIGSLTGGTSLDIAIDPTTDEPGISYFDKDATSLKYTYYTGSSWSATTVENGADYGRFNSIAYDSLGNVHISHERNSADDLYYTSDKTGSWVTTLVHATDSTGTYTSIAVDGNDDIHIAYRYNTGADLYHATVQGYKTGAVSRADVSGATCSISPSLPFGLTLNQGTCTISGTPTSDGSNITYNLTATSSTGVSKSGEFKMWVTYIAPSIAYAGSPFTYTVGTPITSITPSNTGDSAFWSVSPSLPSGLSLSSSGVISGTPSVEASAATYTITATNSGGSGSATISITVNAEIPSGLSYATENMTLEKGTLMTTNTATVGGGSVTSWGISPSVPSGLSFSSSTGSISGTPSVLQTTAVTYTIYANNSGGSTSANVNITINDVAPSISYSNNDITGTKNVAISPSIDPTTSGGTITSWEISPSPGSAFQFNPANGQISGTPSIVLSRTQYTIWGNNSGGHSVAYVNVTINDVSPNTIVYSSHDLTLEKGTAMTTTTPAISGGSVTSWEISPSIPAGMAFSASTGAISGTPTGLQTTAVAYTIWANNSGGWTSTEMNITINDQAASITYPAIVEVSNDRTMTTVTPTNTGGAVPTWEIHPSLPSSLNFGSSNGSIWGTPTGLLANVTYTVYANNSGGSPSTTFILGINWTLTPSAEGAYITRNSSIASDITWEWDYDSLEAQNLSLVTGEWNTCALDNNGNVFCWGRNGNGQIGNGQTGTAGCGSSGHKCKDTPTATNDLGSDVISLAFGHQHACGLLDTGVMKCWGRNNNGQLGTSGGDKDTPQTINLGYGRTATSIYAGGHSTCAILDDASVKCWGENDKGQLGIGSSSLSTSTPTTISSLGTGRTAVSLATAFNAVCALLDDGSVKCWGDDSEGQLGNGVSTSNLNSPPASAINLGTGRTAKAITGGEFHFCAILDDDSIKCWGEGDDGKLGTGSTGNKNTPTSTSGSFASGRYAVAIDAGYDHTCAILDNGQLTCWGSDADGQLGNGATTGTKSSLQSSTVSLGTGRTAISLSAGGEHTCAQLDNGQLKCWGNRADGQVGDNGNFNNPSDRTSPSSVSSNNHGGNTYLNTGVMPSFAVTGATCAISPALPTGLSLTAGTCTITGTPTATGNQRNLHHLGQRFRPIL
jgi:alpha-tubulin suppressor-like RCC1 family protein